jgi:hypothetical protein
MRRSWLEPLLLLQHLGLGQAEEMTVVTAVAAVAAKEWAQHGMCSTSVSSGPSPAHQLQLPRLHHQHQVSRLQCSK